MLRDLGSRNGTFVDGHRVSGSESVPLSRGSTLHFGSMQANGLVVRSVDAPVATGLADGVEVTGSSEFLALPDEDHPIAVISLEGPEGWMCSVADGTTAPVADGQRIVVEGRSWELMLPEVLDPTREAASVVSAGLKLHFAVSADEEYVELEAVVAGTSHRLRPRAHQEALLVLARARLEDQANDVPESEQGWVYTSDLARMMNATSNRLHVSLHRAKKELQALEGATELEVLERRRTTQQVRVATPFLAVSSL